MSLDVYQKLKHASRLKLRTNLKSKFDVILSSQKTSMGFNDCLKSDSVMGWFTFYHRAGIINLTLKKYF